MNMLGNVFDKSTDAVFGINTAGVIQYTNRSFERLMGYSARQLRGSQCANILCGTELCGRPFCGPNCPIPKTVTGQPSITDFDLVVRHADGDSMLVNIGTSYISSPSQRENKDGVDVLFSMRKVSPRRLLQRMAIASVEKRCDQSARYNRLSAREKEVLDLAAKGMATGQIASHLSISTLTVRSHFKNIYPKLGVNSRTDAVIYAMQHGSGTH